jgi:hypothetical protein
MEELCEQAFLRMPNDVMRMEIAKAVNGASDGKLSSDELFSGPKEWFGLNITAGLNQKRLSAMDRFKDRAKHLPRHERRKLASEWNLSTAHGRARWKENLLKPPFSLSNEFPLNLVEPEFVAQWIVGERSEFEFAEKLLMIANSPRTMVTCVLDETKERDTIYSILRNEGARQNAAMEERLRNLVSAITVGTHDAKELRNALRKALDRGEFYRSVISGYGEISSNSLSDKDAISIATRCPAVRTFTNVYMAYAYALFDSTIFRVEKGRPSISVGKQSDFGDIMHSVYAPYSYIFRCDSHFGALLKQDAAIRARIADKRRRLLELGTRAAA